jgi:uncharacterized protein YndB with AHSA1/START domain
LHIIGAVARTTFVYVTYIAAAPERVWHALLDGEFTRRYWGKDNVSDWRPGSAWEHRDAQEPYRAAIVGEVLEARPPHRLVLTWAFPEDRARRDRHSRVSFDIEPLGDMVRLTVTHANLEPGSTLAHGITSGWPRVLSSLKTLLETGRALDTWRGMSA